MKYYIRRVKNFAHLLVAIIANLYYRFPSEEMTVIGITGTDGKTTTANLLTHILNTAGKKTALISTIGAQINGKVYETGFHVTTPSSFLLQKYIRKARNAGCKFLILEITSHALDQKRSFGIHFDGAILTNVSDEHLDYHKTYQKYVTTKLSLLKRSPFNVVNIDDKSFDYVKKLVPEGTLFTYSLEKEANITPKSFSFKTNLLGDYNAYNILAASALAKKLAIPDKTIKDAIETFTPPKGRQQVIVEKDFTVMVDFAHTPNSFQSVLSDMRKRTKGRIIHVFGCAGQRDAGKRKVMGKIAAIYDDIIVLTAEDPRGESIRDINKEIKKGFGERFNKIEIDEAPIDKSYIEIDDRKEALAYALSIAQKGDLVLSTGKGHEMSMNLGDGEIHWSEQEVLEELLGL